MELKDKKQVQLSSRNDSITIKPKMAIHPGVKATLKWKSAVDLDLYCMYELKDGTKGTIYYGRKGSLNSKPFIKLDQDSGIGDTAGDNEENMEFGDISKIKYAIIVANIFAKMTSFAKYNASVIVQNEDTAFTVPLTTKKVGSWCVVAKVDNSGDETKLINVNKTQIFKPALKKFI